MKPVPLGNDRVVQPSALHLSPGLRHVDLPPKVLATVLPRGSQGAATGTCEFVVTTPEVRCRVLGALIWQPLASNTLVAPSDYWFLSGGLPTSLFQTTALWLAKREESALGGRGHVPVENLAGDIFTALPIPEPGCLGWSFEVETSGDEVWGRFFVDAELIGAGTWVLKAACDAIDPMTEGEWNRVHSRFGSRVLAGLNLVEGPRT